jgi:hypothetical protein
MGALEIRVRSIVVTEAMMASATRVCGMRK